MNAPRLPLSRLSQAVRKSPLIATIIALCVNWPCRADPEATDCPTSPPTATGVFHLRSECAALGNQILRTNVVGLALTQSAVSHYKAVTNRCYVLLTVQAAKLAHRPYRIDSYLYDGQTGEMLAALHGGFADDNKGGIVYDRSHEPASISHGYYDDTKAYIDGLMDVGQR